MHHVRQEALPFVGMSHQFIGADHGDVAISSYFVNAPPGRGAPPHGHPYDKVCFVREGRVRWTINGLDHEAGPGDIFVIKAGEIHHFTNLGTAPALLFDVHLAPRFIQENV